MADSDITADALKTTDSPEGRRDRRAFSVIALTFAMIAFVLAALSPWVAPAFDPDQREIEDRAVDVVVAFKDKLAARMKGEAPPKQEWDPKSVNWYPASAIGFGAIGLCFGVIGFVSNEHRRLSLSAILLSISAMLLQYFLLMAAALLLIIMIAAIVGSIGG